MIPIGPAMKNGIRHPQSVIVDSPRPALRTVTSREPIEYPMNVPKSSQLPRNPRRRSGAYSAMNVVAPPYSPPVEKPCTIRATSRSIGAQMPMEP